MTLGQILLDCYRRTGYKDVPPGEITTRFCHWAQESQDEIISEPGCEAILRLQTTFATVADQAEYALGMAFARISSVRDVDRRIILEPMREHDYRRRVPDPSQSGGTPRFYVPLALAPVALRPSNASEIFIKSTSALDIQTVFWEVLTTGGELRSAEVTMNGVTAVSFSASVTDAVQVVNVTLSQAANGTVTIHEDSGAGAEIGRISIGEVHVTRPQLALYPTPSDAYTMTVEGERDATPLLQTNDVPIIPARFHSMIGVGIRKREYELRGNSVRYAMAKGEWDEWRDQLRRYLDQTDGVIIPGGRSYGWSPLGPNFPAEWWPR